LIHHKADGSSICGLPSIILDSENAAELNESVAATNQENDIAPSKSWSPLETQIRDVLAKVSKIDKQQIPKTIGFYHLGLDSVSAIKVASLLRKNGIRLPVSEIIKAQTVEKMALVAARLGSSSQDRKPAPSGNHRDKSMSLSFLGDMGVESTDVEQVLPATAGQTYMLDMWSASKGRLFYPTFWLSVSETTSERIHQAMKRLTKSMPMLRTKFVRNQEGKLLSLVIREANIEAHEFPWSLHVEEQKQNHLVTLKLHHALYDAVSLQVMLRELGNLCQTIDYKVLAKGNLEDFVSETQAKDDTRKEFWIKYLTRDFETFPVLSRGSFDANRVEKFNPEVMRVSQLREALRHHGISIQALFFGVYAQVYATRLQRQPSVEQSRTASTDVIIGIYLANRSLDIDDLTELGAPTFNIVPLRIQTANSSIIEIAQRVQQDLGEISRLENCGVSMREIYSWTGIQADTYVNFLSLPRNEAGEEEDDTARPPSQSAIDVNISHIKVDSEMKSKAADIVETSPFLNDTEQGLATHEWCLVSFTSL
jgi:aryl carrier-like protein